MFTISKVLPAGVEVIMLVCFLSCGGQSIDRLDLPPQVKEEDALYSYMKESADALLILWESAQNEAQFEEWMNDQQDFREIFKRTRLVFDSLKFPLLVKAVCNSESLSLDNQLLEGIIELASMIGYHKNIVIRASVNLEFVHPNTVTQNNDKFDRLVIYTSIESKGKVLASMSMSIMPPDWLWEWDIKYWQQIYRSDYPYLPIRLKRDLRGLYKVYTPLGLDVEKFAAWKASIADQVQQFYLANSEGIEGAYQYINDFEYTDSLLKNMDYLCYMIKSDIEIQGRIGACKDKVDEKNTIDEVFIGRWLKLGDYENQKSMVRFEESYQCMNDKNRIILRGYLYNVSDSKIINGRFDFIAKVNLNETPP